MKNKRPKVKESAPPVQTGLRAMPAQLLFISLAVWSYFVVKFYFRSGNFQPFSSSLISWIFSTELYDRHGNPAIIISHLINVLIAVLMILSSCGFGKRIWELLKFSGEGQAETLEESLFQTGLGFGAMIFFTLIIGFLGLLYSLIMWGFIIAGVLLSLPQLINSVKQQNAARAGRIGNVYFIPFIIIIVAFIVNLLGALVPETFYDSLTYNIGLSQNWINHHTIFSSSNMLVSFYPLNFTVLHTAGILLKDEIAAKLISLAFVTGTGLSIYVFCRKYFSRETGIIAALLFYTVPIIMNVSWKTAIEPGLAFFEFLALFCFINWCNENKAKWFYLCAIFAGIALGGKYTSFITAVTMFCLVFVKVVLLDKEGFGKGAKKALIFSTIVFSLTAVWYVKNYIIIGDPLYPLLWKLNNQIQNSDPPSVKLTVSNIMFFPWKYTMGTLQQETLLGPLFLIALPLVLVIKNVNRNIKLLSVYFVIYFVLWFFIGKAYLRFFLPGLAVLSIILSYCISNLPSLYGLKKFMLLFLSIMAFGNIVYSLLIQKQSLAPIGYVLGMQSKKEYLDIQRSSYPNVYYSAAEWLNKNADKGAGVLILGECRGYYVERRFINHMANEPNPIVAYVKSVSNEEELYEKLKGERIKYMLLNVPEAIRLSSYDLFNWNAKELGVFASFWNKHVREVYKFCGDVTLNNGNFGSRVPQFWSNYSASPYNYVYVYEIAPLDQTKPPAPCYNFFLDQRLYSEKMKKVLQNQ